MRIGMREVGGSEVLAGALNGKVALTRLLAAAMTEPALPEPLYLDFSGVEVATASFLRESVLSFRDIVRGRHSTFYPVIANANDNVRDELVELVRARGDVLVTCTLHEDGSVAEGAQIGSLDPKQRVTLELVRERGETDAGELMRTHGKSEGLAHATAWNNRLASLASLGLIVELAHGRAKRYRPLFEGI
jgi:hypothetical protein